VGVFVNVIWTVFVEVGGFLVAVSLGGKGVCVRVGDIGVVAKASNVDGIIVEVSTTCAEELHPDRISAKTAIKNNIKTW